MADSEFSITPFSELPPEVREQYRDKANWMIQLPEGERGDWLRARDTFYRVDIDHILVQQGDKKPFDKYNVRGWGVGVLPMRVSHDMDTNLVASFCVPTEHRFLVPDASGDYGKVSIPNLIQGGTKKGETFAEAARREALEEAGISVVKDMLLLDRTLTEPSNSESHMEIYLALVGGEPTVDQTLDETEIIDSQWYSWAELQSTDLREARLKATLFDVYRNLDPKLLEPKVYGRYEIPYRRYELSPNESLLWYIRDERYLALKAQTVPTYHPFDSQEN